MFGLLNLLYTGGVMAAGSAIKSSHNSKSRQQAINAGRLFYIDYEGKSRDVKTNNILAIYWDEYGEKHVKDLVTGKDTNLSQQKCEQEYLSSQLNPNNNSTVYKYFDSRDKYPQFKFKDLKNGRIYRSINIKTGKGIKEKYSVSFYIDDISCEIIRPIDEDVDREGNEWLIERVKQYNQYEKFFSSKNQYLKLNFDNLNGVYYF